LALAVVVVIASITVAAVFFLRGGGDNLPRPGSENYREMVSSFYAGVTALDVNANEQARISLSRATELVPEEPAAWADRGLLKLRLEDHEGAAGDLEQARKLAPESGAVEQFLALLDNRRGRVAEAITHLRRAVELSPKDLKARFALAQEIERSGNLDSDAQALRLMNELVDLQPDNLEVLRERARLAAKCDDSVALDDSVARLGRLAPHWPPKAEEAYRELEKATKSKPWTAANRGLFQRNLASLRNLLVQTPAFRQSLAAIQTPVGMVGEPIETFLRLPPPPSTPSPADDALTFAVEQPGEATSGWNTLLAVPMTGAGPPTLCVANTRSVRRVDGKGPALPFPGSPESPPSPHGILPLDWNSDYRMDLVFAGAGGLKVFEQKEGGTFADVTAATKLDPVVVDANAFGVWAADIEMDGDLDLVLGATRGKVSVLRNNGDGTFSPIQPFEGATDLRDFAWADLDGDGDPDAALLDVHGDLRIYTNERAGRFQPRPVPDGLGTVAAVAVADLNSDGVIDLLALRKDGPVLRISDRDEGHAWAMVEVVGPPQSVGNAARLFVADLDNSGAADLIGAGASGEWIELADGKGGFRSLAAPAGLTIFAVADFNSDGQLDLAGLSGEGRSTVGRGRGTKDYHWQVIRPRGAQTFGDGRINSFGLAGEVEVRAGLLVQKQVIQGPIVHFGLGDRPKADFARIVWPNGTVQAEFSAQIDRELVAEQRLKGSCPFLFAFDGNAIRFVTDLIWRSPLGLRINAQDTAGVSQTEDWVKISGDQLAPRLGDYDIRITAELWETHYWDYVSLMVVDHPAGTEVFVDERFARQPPPLVVIPTGPLDPVAYARDDRGRDVTEDVAARDGRYLDVLGRSFYQGIAGDHWVEGVLGEDAPRDRPLWLVAHGWSHPTDSSINVAIGQGQQAKPQDLVLEVPASDGGWEVARPDLGFPAGKNKTILVDLDGVFRPEAARRLRLRTNLEVYWDSLAVAEAAPQTPLMRRRLAPVSAELRLRGYSLMTQANSSSPELPDYRTLAGQGQRWRDLIGFYTRFGDVHELLDTVDDRYVIANAGDELVLRFAAAPPPPDGWTRDFVLIGDGWNKDGDYNTAFSKTVLPLPSHQQRGYDTQPGAIEDDPVYRFHPEDWREYHTRYVTPADFQRGLRPQSAARAGRGPE
jgi:tetratricopeptide (TPR) repeat protein